MEGIILILGHTNSMEGILSTIAQDRLQMGITVHQQHSTFAIVCTGGFGEHFNTTQYPHAMYAQQYLVEQGIDASLILNPVLSKNTVEDASLSRSVLEQYKPQMVIVVSSDFHMPRVKYLFTYFQPSQPITFISATSALSKECLQQLTSHEEQALARLKSMYLSENSIFTNFNHPTTDS
ncbi:YdcF family protein [Cytophagaceae bacterium YF14B1]|uniref:YdcF family protein n=1 Tax=Xanthocytophaga flava TaxID=3048013 RepID=A0AAE3QUS9_9BACT|nr:YdcF family protein [Xanthocytophaga flavus]MDJ1483890.1 YdcF family protein [Xanthocytophaga flavus]